MAPPVLRHAFDLKVDVAVPISLGSAGQGERRIVPITGGHVSGRLTGRILPGGADDQMLCADGVTRLDARYLIETTDGALIHVENSGLRHGPPELMERIRRGEPVDPSAIYFRCSPRFHTTSEPYRWLTRALFVGTGERGPDDVRLAIFEIV